VAGIRPSCATLRAREACFALTRSLAKAGAPGGILVNAIRPSNIDSPMLCGPFAFGDIQRVLESVPLGRTAQPWDVAELVRWLSSDACTYVTGANWDINGGWFMS
jgi:NAD(P)-dependent dehydrogenase (short-subunit alcohol dehydrogenase family)